MLHARTLEAIGKRDDHVMLATIAGADLRLARQLYFMLALVCEGPVLSKVECAGQGEGFLAWKRIMELYEPDPDRSQAAVLQHILSYSFGGCDIRPAINKFELLVRRIAEQSGEELHDAMQKNITDENPKGHLILYVGGSRAPRF